MKIKRIKKHLSLAPKTIEIVEKIMVEKGMTYSTCIDYLIQENEKL